MTGTPWTRVSGSFRWVCPVRIRSIPGHLLREGDDAVLVVRSRSARRSPGRPRGRCGSGRRRRRSFSFPRRSGTRRFAVSTGSSHVRPGRFAAGSQPGMFGVVRPRTPTRTPPISLTTYSGNAALPSAAFRVFAESHGKEESFCALAQDVEAEVELVVADRHRVVAAGRSSRPPSGAARRSGDAPRASPSGRPGSCPPRRGGGRSASRADLPDPRRDPREAPVAPPRRARSSREGGSRGGPTSRGP